MACLWWTLLAGQLFFLIVQNADGVLRFASYYNDHMVLQMTPAKAQIWGYATHIGDTVHVTLNGTHVADVNTTRRHDGHSGSEWSALLPPQQAGGPFTIEVRSKDGHAVLNDVLFGDVWVCSGQSNMYFTMGQVFNHTTEIDHATRFSKIRIVKLSLHQSNTTVDEPSIESQWQHPKHDTATSNFSAVCLLYGEEIYPHIHRPIGLVETAWGGTPIEAWSSPDALSNCTHQQKRGPTGHSVLWNAMVYPLLKMTIFGVLWYQGESNSGHADKYACQFPVMIDDWRSKFNRASHRQTNLQFPFGFVQLAPTENKTLHHGRPDLRWSQTAGYGYVPNPRLPNVFMAVSMDLPDYVSPYGPIHPRDKHTVARRLALAGRAVAYGENNIDYQGPLPTDFTLVGHRLVIEFDQGNSAIEIRTHHGFEVCCGHTASDTCSSEAWTAAPIVAHDQSTVSIDTSGCSGNKPLVNAVRYIWDQSPCEFKKCAIYDKNNDLPAPLFTKQGPFKTQ